ncbi:MAG: hypothetical protein PHP38_11560 [Sphaerochaetaceae bacterium]|nr:hypothetical protein [Sphaerochaetaceae bacterium]MDD4842528.1 hypothetical protein [Sphaerochaetaceae bacterium]NLO60293.1 hypothetical protein [Spirochaetales bacterium]
MKDRQQLSQLFLADQTCIDRTLGDDVRFLLACNRSSIMDPEHFPE